MNKKLAIVILILAACVLLFFTMPNIIRSLKLKNHGVFTESTVLSSKRQSSSKGPSTYIVTVTFNIPDGSGVLANARKRSSVHDGEKVMIYYDRNAPQKIDFGDSIGYNMRGAILGGLILIFGFFLLIRQISNDSASSKLIRSGQKISAEFVSVDRNERYRMGDNNPWIIKCKWTDNRNNLEYYFLSKDYTIDPGPYLNGRYHIDVYINPDDPARYYMDTSFMPKGNNTIG